VERNVMLLDADLIADVKRLPDAVKSQRDQLVGLLEPIAAVGASSDLMAMTRAHESAGRALKLLGDWLGSPLKEQLEEELVDAQKTTAEKAGSVWKNRLTGLLKSGMGRGKLIAIGVGVFVVVVFLGAGLPLLLNALKSKRDDKTAVASLEESVGSHLVSKEEGLESRTALRGASLVMTPGLTAKADRAVTYTLALRIGGSGDIDGAGELLVMQRTPSDSIVSAFTVYVDPQMRRLKVFLKKEAGGYCAFVAEDLPLYRWCVVHVVFNNTPQYRTTHVFIDGKLLKVGNHDTCEGGVVNQAGDTLRVGGNQVLEVQYLKVVPRTLMQDEIKAEAASIVADINQYYMDQLMLQMQCAL
jgi:hypothetical protein